MNKKIIIGIVVIVIIAAAAYWFSQNNSKIDDKGVLNRLADDSKMAPQKLSLRSLLTKNQALKCTITAAGATNTFYMADNNVRSDFSTVANNKTVVGHTIVKDKTSYTWMDGEKNGFKVTAEESANGDSTNKETQTQGKVDFDSEYSYDCSSWNKDASYFEAPKDVKFVDLNSMMPKIPSMPNIKR